MADDVFKALADPTRRRILDELTDRNGQTLFEICGRLTTKHGLGLSRQAVSQHLAVLEAAGLVITRREGRYKFHDLDTGPLEHVVGRWLGPRTPQTPQPPLSPQRPQPSQPPARQPPQTQQTSKAPQSRKAQENTP